MQTVSVGVLTGDKIQNRKAACGQAQACIHIQP
jgi:hypothetical protein